MSLSHLQKSWQKMRHTVWTWWRSPEKMMQNKQKHTCTGARRLWKVIHVISLQPSVIHTDSHVERLFVCHWTDSPWRWFQLHWSVGSCWAWTARMCELTKQPVTEPTKMLRRNRRGKVFSVESIWCTHHWGELFPASEWFPRLHFNGLYRKSEA